jgi:hypothetical protein
MRARVIATAGALLLATGAQGETANVDLWGKARGSATVDYRLEVDLDKMNRCIELQTWSGLPISGQALERCIREGTEVKFNDVWVDSVRVREPFSATRGHTPQY